MSDDSPKSTESKKSTESTDSKPKINSEPKADIHTNDNKSKKKLKPTFIAVIVVIVAISLFAWAEQQRRDANEKLAEVTQELEDIRSVSEGTTDEAAQRIIDRVRQHMNIPENPLPTVATIQDIDALRASENAFYDKAENGDHLLITPTRAILYDPDSDRIIDVVPVRIERKADDDSASGDTR